MIHSANANKPAYALLADEPLQSVTGGGYVTNNCIDERDTITDHSVIRGRSNGAASGGREGWLSNVDG